MHIVQSNEYKCIPAFECKLINFIIILFEHLFDFEQNKKEKGSVQMQMETPTCAFIYLK